MSYGGIWYLVAGGDAVANVVEVVEEVVREVHVRYALLRDARELWLVWRRRLGM